MHYFFFFFAALCASCAGLQAAQRHVLQRVCAGQEVAARPGRSPQHLFIFFSFWKKEAVACVWRESATKKNEKNDDAWNYRNKRRRKKKKEEEEEKEEEAEEEEQEEEEAEDGGREQRK